MKATHKVTQVEAVYMPDLLKKHLQSDINASQLTSVISNDSFDYIYRLIDQDIDKNAHDFDELMLIFDRCKDMNLNQKCGEIISHIEGTEFLKRQYEDHKKESKSDMSSADGSDNR